MHVHTYVETSASTLPRAGAIKTNPVKHSNPQKRSCTTLSRPGTPSEPKWRQQALQHTPLFNVSTRTPSSYPRATDPLMPSTHHRSHPNTKKGPAGFCVQLLIAKRCFMLHSLRWRRRAPKLCVLLEKEPPPPPLFVCTWCQLLLLPTQYHLVYNYAKHRLILNTVTE